MNLLFSNIRIEMCVKKFFTLFTFFGFNFVILYILIFDFYLTFEKQYSSSKILPAMSSYSKICFFTDLPTPFQNIFMPPPFEEWWRGIKCYPCPCVRSSVRACMRASVIKSWCQLNNFWKTASIQFKFGMLIYNIKTQVKFDLGYNFTNFWRSYGPFIKT